MWVLSHRTDARITFGGISIVLASVGPSQGKCIFANLLPFIGPVAVAVVSGIIGAETRGAIAVVSLMNDPAIHELEENPLKGSHFRRYRYLIGIVTAYEAVVYLGIDLQPLQQIAMAILASLGGTSFILSRVESTAENEIGAMLKNRVVSIKRRKRKAPFGSGLHQQTAVASDHTLGEDE